MAIDEEQVNERTNLLPTRGKLNSVSHQGDASSIISSHVSKDEQVLGETAVGERLPYNDYTTIDWLHDLVSTSYSICFRDGRSRMLGKRLFQASTATQP
jgi:chloride channel 3/4/5